MKEPCVSGKPGFCLPVMRTVVGRRTSPKDVHMLILGTTKMLPYKGKHSAGVIKVKDFEMGRLTQIMQMNPF